jgi:uncharacterized protein
MTLSLYSAIVPSYRQILGAMAGLLDKAEAFCTDTHVAPGELIQARFAEDMQPFAYQIKSTVVHSVGAIEGVRQGVFSPDRSTPPQDFASLKQRIADGIAALEAVTAAEVDGFVGRDMAFAFADRRIGYTAENFLLSFSQPNFYFHAATAYDLLRWKGVQIGKRDFMGRTRAKGAA